MRFDRLGLAFEHPDNWTVEIDATRGRRIAVTVYAPAGGFWSLSSHDPGVPAAELAAAVAEEMRSHYAELDAEPVEEIVGDLPLRGFDLNFYCLDLTNTAQVRTLETADAVYLLLCQAEDREWAETAAVFAAMTASFVAGLGAVAGGQSARSRRP